MFVIFKVHPARIIWGIGWFHYSNPYVWMDRRFRICCRLFESCGKLTYVFLESPARGGRKIAWMKESKQALCST